MSIDQDSPVDVNGFAELSIDLAPFKRSDFAITLSEHLKKTGESMGDATLPKILIKLMKHTFQHTLIL